LWVEEKDNATLKLFNEFGIELPTLKVIKKMECLSHDSIQLPI